MMYLVMVFVLMLLLIQEAMLRCNIASNSTADDASETILFCFI